MIFIRSVWIADLFIYFFFSKTVFYLFNLNQIMNVVFHVLYLLLYFVGHCWSIWYRTVAWSKYLVRNRVLTDSWWIIISIVWSCTWPLSSLKIMLVHIHIFLHIDNVGSLLGPQWSWGSSSINIFWRKILLHLLNPINRFKNTL